MLAIEPGGHNGGDKELRAIAADRQAVSNRITIRQTDRNSRVGTSVGHGEDTRLGVLELEVLIGELLAVDGATTGALKMQLLALILQTRENMQTTYIVAGEVTTLEHELGDDAVEAGALVALALGSLAELTEVAGSLGHVSLEEVEDNATRLGW